MSKMSKCYKEPRRVMIESKQALEYYRCTYFDTDVASIRDLYEKLGCGRSNFAVMEDGLLDCHRKMFSEYMERESKRLPGMPKILMCTCDKEVYPPIFRLGEF